MPVTVIQPNLSFLPREYSQGAAAGSTADAIGQGLSTGLSGILNQLAQNRAMEMQARKVAPALQKLLQLTSPEEAVDLAYLANAQPKLLQPFLTQMARTPFPVEGSDIGQFIEGLSPQQLQAYRGATPGEKQTILRALIEDPARYIKGYGQQPQQSILNQLAQSMQQQPISPLRQLSESELMQQAESANKVNKVLSLANKEIEPNIEKPKESLAQKAAEIRKDLIQNGIPLKEATKAAVQLAKADQAKAMSAAEKKHQESLISAATNLNELMDTAQRMLNTIKSGKLNTGIIPGLGAKIAPTLLNTESEQFDKDAAHLINLTSENIKGIPSRYRVALIEKEKPGLHHSMPVNKQILERINDNANKRLEHLYKANPNIKKITKEEPNQTFAELPPASEFEGKIARNPSTGQRMRSINGKWEPIKE